MDSLPSLALSVRQPWAWAIVAGYKPIENRTLGAIRSGGMVPGRICIHAAKGLKRKEFEWGHWRLEKHGVTCPRPETLVRGAIIGVATVTDIVDRSDSPWFGGPYGLCLEDATEVEPIPCPGALGYFKWQRGGDIASPQPWMLRFDALAENQEQFQLFDSLPITYSESPERPSRARKLKNT